MKITTTKKQLGVTLVELIVVGVILTMIFTMAGPNFLTIVNQNRASVAADTLAFSARLARSESVKRGNIVNICPTATGDSCTTGGTTNWSNGWITYADLNGDDSYIDGDDQLIEVQDDIDPQVTITTSGNIRYNLSFLPDGLLNTGGSTVSIDVCTPDSGVPGKNIKINLIGFTKVNPAGC